MAEVQKAKGGKKAPNAEREPARRGTLMLGRRNVLLLVAGIVVILLGYVLLGKGSISAAPVLLVVGYCVIVPLSIVLWTRKPSEKQPVQQTAQQTAQQAGQQVGQQPGTGE